MGKILGKSKLASLNTIINYDYFDKYTNNCDNYPSINAAKSKLDKFQWNTNISDKLLNALCYVYIREKNKKLYKNTCDYLYYWLGSKVLNNLRHKFFFFEVIKTIYAILSEGELGNVCDPVNSIYDYNFQKFKDIYDLSENYHTYELDFIKMNPPCNKDYDEAIKSYRFLYNKLRNECSMEKTYNNIQYCNVFNDFFTKEKDAQISSWTCQLTETEEQDEHLDVEYGEEADNEQLPETSAVEGLQRILLLQ
ncbi:hypothetical protein PVNG_06128 [Plasmodium vivax North Korean]|uniref:Uncharacterized protein n=1 Tax=Plasmodium vivax North Korean TaxID=1035514 RepID=A0A0J9U1C8_PLAVI|nr:hypothetical protein PVNG_06128 [Plasmodium vivax North Korean]